MYSVVESGDVSLHLSDLAEVANCRTMHAHVVVYRHRRLGQVLVLDGEIQHVEAWAPLYHEPLVHLAAAFVEVPRSVLLLGGGSLFAAREVLKYRTIQRVLMLDRDQELLDVVTQHYEHAQDVRRDPRLEIRFVEAFGGLASLKENFDLIINDCDDLTARGRRIFQELAFLLRPSGICSDVMFRHCLDLPYVEETTRILAAQQSWAMSLIFVPEYPGILHLLTLWSNSSRLSQKARSPANREQLSWISAPDSNPCAYYDPRYFAYHLHLPRYVRERLAPPLT